MAKKTKKRKNKALINWLFFGTLVIIVAAISYYSYTQTREDTRWTLQEFQSTESTYMGDLQLSILASATLHPYELLEVRPEASGKILELYFEAGDWLDEGDPMALLDQEDLLIRVDTARANLSSAYAQLAQTERGYTPGQLQSYDAQVESAQLALAEAQEDLDHTRELHDGGFASDEELDNAEYAVEHAQQSLDHTIQARDVLLEGSTSEEIQVARANVTVAEASVQEAENALGNATIYSPISGVVMDRLVSEGSVIVSSLASFSGGDVICTIGDLTRMKAYASVDESDIGLVEEGQKVLLDVDAYRDVEFDGTVIKIHPQADATGGVNSFTVEIEVPNPDGKLMSGMRCEVEIITESITDILLVPDRAIAESNDKQYVFVVKEDKSIEARVIEIGRTNYEYTEVLSGLEEGEEVIVRGVPSDLLEELDASGNRSSGGHIIISSG
ncbi:MAG: efflux RND transporter periplasmic adaptor subunit [bacterium]|nr:efflux RND transporter periplasmic adaptor subunit [bacterium]